MPLMNEPPLRVLLLEDQLSDAELIARALAQGAPGCVTQRVDNPAAFTRALRDFVPHVVLSDHAVPDFDAVAALRAIRNTRPATPLIIVSGAFDQALAVRALKAGADDYLIKDDLSRLPAAIEAALSTRKLLTRLTPRQHEVLQLLAEGVPTRGIAGRLKLSVKTVETHRAAIMKRLGIRDIPGLVRYAVRVGLVAP